MLAFQAKYCRIKHINYMFRVFFTYLIIFCQQNTDSFIMKATNENEKLKKVGYRLPPDICDKLNEIAVINRRSINDEVIEILRDYFNMPIKWEKWIIQTIKKIAIEKGYTISWAINYLVATRLNQLDEASKNNEPDVESPVNKESQKTAG